ncbi:hypothetical protein HK104_010129 [Borealophlyctis nickersoniae]|nr:hypothetical protein HK104_010129 [Borealophlyctis nickersoniae]
MAFLVPSTVGMEGDWYTSAEDMGKAALAAYVVDMLFYFLAAYLYGVILVDRFTIFAHILRYPRWLIPALYRMLATVYSLGYIANIVNLWYERWTFILSPLSLSGFVVTAIMDLTMGPMMVRKVLMIRRELEDLSIAQQGPDKDADGQEHGMKRRLSQAPTITGDEQPQVTEVETGRAKVETGRTGAGTGVGMGRTPVVEARLRFLVLFAISMALDVIAFSMYGLRYLLPGQKAAVKLLMATFASIQ